MPLNKETKPNHISDTRPRVGVYISAEVLSVYFTDLTKRSLWYGLLNWKNECPKMYKISDKVINFISKAMKDRKKEWVQEELL